MLNFQGEKKRSTDQRSQWFQMNRSVFVSSVLIIMAMLFLNYYYSGYLKEKIGSIQSAITGNFGWMYILSMSFFLIVCVCLMLSRVGRLRLGSDDDRPEFSTLSWLSMLFSAGMGIGILFYSVAEPIYHLSDSTPRMLPGSSDAGRNSMGLTIFHWGLHPWACYGLVGLILGYFSYRKGLPLSLRSALFPFIGKKVFGPVGHAVDTLTIVSTLFGVATSLGLGAMQVSSGFEHVFGWTDQIWVQIAIIGSITALATLSVISGLNKGIRILSQANLILALFLLLAVFLSGPTLHLLNSMVQNVGSYIDILQSNSFYTGVGNPEHQSWLGGWTIFYWAWWIAWSPFVGIFIARISKGRTIREFLAAVLLVPLAMTLIWMTVFGDSAIYFEQLGNGGIAAAVQNDISTAIYHLLELLPFSTFTSLVAVLSIILFFVTSSDSASLVIDTIASGGVENPPVWQKVFWASLEGLVASFLLMYGGLKALQTGAITSALPFSLILILASAGLFIQLRRDLSV